MGYAIPGPFDLNAYFSGVPINLVWHNPIYVGTPFVITGNIAVSNMGPPTPIVGASMHFVIDGNNNGYVVSDTYGNFKFTWNNPSIGNHTLTVSWVGNSAYPQGGSVTTSFTVSSAVTPAPTPTPTPAPVPAPSSVTTTSILNWLTIMGAVMAGYGWWKKR